LVPCLLFPYTTGSSIQNTACPFIKYHSL
jgi:hypothetical protein